MGQAGKSCHPRVCLHDIAATSDDEFALRATQRSVSGGPANLKGLHMFSFVTIRMGNSSELNLECGIKIRPRGDRQQR
jgi:hypothetical protein